MRHSLLRAAGAAALVASMAAAVAPAPASASRLPAVASVKVYVGYADREHGEDVASFPSPWAGATDTAYQGCEPADRCHYDGGAIRIVNDSAVSVSIDQVAASVDTCEYDGWQPAELQPHHELIVAQLASGTADGCTGPDATHFDTSDVGPGGSSYNGQCAPDGIVPTVSVTVDGSSTTYLDATQVLNTGGLDVGGCPVGTNESHPWLQLEGEYVALGDSFSSGEGIASYFPGTDVAGTNECHRSERGYPVLVRRALRFDRFGFFACSGAIVGDLWGTGGPTNPGVGTIGGTGQWNEQPQLTHVDHDDTLVTLSIGGNDIGFGDLLKGCVAEGAAYFAVNALIGHVNSTVIAFLNRRIGDINSIIDKANSINPFFDIPTIGSVPNVPLLTDPGSCLSSFPGMLAVLSGGGPERLYKKGNTVIGPCAPPNCAAPPAGAAVINFTAPSLTQLYLQIAKQAAPNAKIVVLLYPPIVNPAGITRPCSIGLDAPFHGTATATIHPFQLVPLLDDLPGFLKKHVPATISREESLRHTVRAELPAFTPTAVTHLLSAATQLNNAIKASVAAAATVDPDITYVDPAPQFSPPVDGGRGGWFCNGTASTNVLGGPRTISPFFNEIMIKASTLTITTVNLSVPDVRFTLGDVDPGSVHPNAKGARADACAILGISVAACGQ